MQHRHNNSAYINNNQLTQNRDKEKQTSERKNNVFTDQLPTARIIIEEGHNQEKATITMVFVVSVRVFDNITHKIL